MTKVAQSYHKHTLLVVATHLRSIIASLRFVPDMKIDDSVPSSGDGCVQRMGVRGAWGEVWTSSAALTLTRYIIAAKPSSP